MCRWGYFVDDGFEIFVEFVFRFCCWVEYGGVGIYDVYGVWDGCEVEGKDVGCVFWR